MRNIFLYLLLVLSVCVNAQEWSVIFHPADKLFGLPNRHACVYNDADSLFELQFRSDIPYVKLITTDRLLENCSDSLLVAIYDNKGETPKDTIRVKADLYENKIVVMRCWSVINCLMKGGRVKIIMYKGVMPCQTFKIYPMRQNDLLNQTTIK